MASFASRFRLDRENARELKIARVVVGVMGLAFGALVLQGLGSDELSYAVRDEQLSSPQSVPVGSAMGRLFFALSFGGMSAAAVLFALKPKLFEDGVLVWAAAIVILASFAGLALVP